MTCTRCDSSGFLNIEQAPGEVSDMGWEAVSEWMKTDDGKVSDVTVCDCCGNGETWYGDPGEHYTTADPIGRNGPYAYNGGLCECN